MKKNKKREEKKSGNPNSAIDDTQTDISGKTAKKPRENIVFIKKIGGGGDKK